MLTHRIRLLCIVYFLFVATNNIFTDRNSVAIKIIKWSLSNSYDPFAEEQKIEENTADFR